MGLVFSLWFTSFNQLISENSRDNLENLSKQHIPDIVGLFLSDNMVIQSK